MLPKTAADKESVDQKEFVNVMLVFTWMIVQVSFRYVILFWILFWPTMRAIVIKKIFFWKFCWKTDSLTTAVLGCIALNYLNKETKPLGFQEKNYHGRSKFTWTILHVKSNVTFTSSFWSTDSLSAAVLGSMALNYFNRADSKQSIYNLKKTILIIG